MQKRALPAYIALGLSALAFAGARVAIAQDTPPASVPQTPPAANQPAASAAKQSPEDTTKKELQAIYDVVDKAMLDEGAVLDDNAPAWKHYAPDFVVITPDGGEKPKTLKELRKGWRATQVQVTNYSGSSTVETIVLQGNTATVEVTAVHSFTMRSPNGTPVGLRIVHHDRDFWVKKDGNWILKRTRLLDAQSEANGKPIILNIH